MLENEFNDFNNFYYYMRNINQSKHSYSFKISWAAGCSNFR